MGKWRENEEMESDSLSTLLTLSLFPPSLSISYIKNCLILSQNVKYGTFVVKVRKKLNIRAMKKIILGRIRCEKAPQVVPACDQLLCYSCHPDNGLSLNNGSRKQTIHTSKT